MSWQATAWAAKQVTGSPARKALLLALANYADAAGMSYPGQDTLARDTEQSVDTVQRQMKHLAALSLVRIEKRPAVKGQWPGLVYFLALPVAEMSEPQSAARTAPRSHAARSGRHRAAKHPLAVPQNAPSRCRTYVRHEQKEQKEQRARATAPVAEGSLRERGIIAGRLGVGGEALRLRIGDDRFDAWFGKVEMVSEIDGEIVLSAPTAFTRSYITAQFGSEIENAYRSTTPNFQRVVIVHQRGEP